ncbi:nucleoside 2-deoxyribosyltransferase [Candidatus Woesearchaeota archaeon]|nr:nucleoside 2-deoxyribosyltransferase [Candidatus Woesearchaeota archaeon]
MKIYVAGCLREEKDRAKLEEVEKLCKEFGETYLPHRDAGIFEDGGDSKKIFKENRDKVDWCDVIVALFDWKGISSGTSWEIGYAYAKNVQVIALVEDKKTVNKDFRICVMCHNSVEMVESLEGLKERLESFK